MRGSMALLVLSILCSSIPCQTPCGAGPEAGVPTGASGAARSQSGAGGLDEGASPGVVVERIGKGTAPERAGVQKGDVLLTWKRAPNPPANRRPASGSFRNPFDVWDLEIEEAPRGRVSITLERGGESRAVDLPPGGWKMGLRPNFAGRDLADWTEGGSLFKSGEEGARSAGAARWEALADRLATKGGSLGAWVRLRLAEEFFKAGQPDRSHAEAKRALADAERSGAHAAVAAVWLTEAKRFLAEQEPAKAEDALTHLQATWERADPGGLRVAAAISEVGMLAFNRGDLDRSEDLFGRALAIRERLAPGSLDMATSLHNLGQVAKDRQAWAAAEEFLGRAKEIREALEPESLDVADSLTSLGAVARERGDLRSAEALLRRALALAERVAPGSYSAAVGLNSMGNICTRRGDLAAAESYYLATLRILEELAPGGLQVATILNNLGELSRTRGDQPAAREYLMKTLAIQEKLAPGSLDVAGTLNNLGNIELEGDDFLAAEDFYTRALAITENKAPGSLSVAQSLNNMGLVQEEMGDLASAEGSFRRALEIKEKQAPESLDVATSLENLGALIAARGDPKRATPHIRRAVVLFSRLAPGSRDEAENLHALAVAERDLGEFGMAADTYCEALRSLETQRGRLGGSDETAAGFAAKYADWYREYVDLLLDLGRGEEAYQIIERSRAQGLLSLLAERDLVLGDDLPEDLAMARREAGADYDRAQATRGELAASDGAAIEKAETAMREIRRRQEEIRAKVRRASPKLAALIDPEPLDLRGARGRLDPGTLLLAYSTGKDSGKLFVIGPGPNDFEIASLPVRREDLRRKVERIRSAIRHSAESGDPRGLESLRTDASGLSRLLLSPAKAKIASAQRVLVIPDGPLHFLPFAALADPSSVRFRWLVEAKPVHTVVSMTVYGELCGGRRTAEGPAKLVAFGDPACPEGAERQIRGVRLGPLPATRDEVESIRALAPDRAECFLGSEATETRAIQVGRDARVVHYACHGIVDERFPLDSALVLAVPQKAPDSPTGNREGNGLLQAWEVFEKVRLGADLVTLSACDTAMGKEMGGEGLVGLVRAFEYAGARSVLASLWSVSDASTAKLMQGFYRRYLGGMPKDQALRQAQLELLATPYSSPFHWAAFELFGDWR
jgi:CHAT domain-containing protein/tetratricopeptide (TPR) repeat protein